MKNQKSLEILVVEDNEKHLMDAKKVVESLKADGCPINVEYASDKDTAIQMLEAKKYGAVISDIFMPSDSNGTMAKDKAECASILPQEILKDYHYSDAAQSWISGNELAPLGVLVTEKALSSDILAVFCTDTYHHGKKTEPVKHYASRKNIGMVDASYEVKDGFAENKDWEKAVAAAIFTYELKAHLSKKKKKIVDGKWKGKDEDAAIKNAKNAEEKAGELLKTKYHLKDLNEYHYNFSVYRYLENEMRNQTKGGK